MSSIIGKDQLKSECLSNGIDINSKEEHVRYIDERDGRVIVETYADFFKFNGGSNKSNNELDTFVPAFEI